jgi:rhodanese-related sulfurtransferase
MTAMTAQDLVAEARQAVEEVGPDRARAFADWGMTVIDVREPHEYAEGHVPGAVNIPRGVLEFKVGHHPALSDPGRALLVYCKTGGRAALVARSLQRMGFAAVSSISGGFDAWQEAELGIDKDPAVC